MTNDGNNTLVYDAENRVVSATNGGSSGSYSYDGNNLRVEKVSSSTNTVYIFSGGQDIAKYLNGADPTSPTNEYIYSGSQQIASIQSGVTHYLHNDLLSLRMRTDTSGNVSDQRGTYPFGETWYSPSGAPWMFSSYYRDTESTNDYALARSYVNRLARFSSVDPLTGTITYPQSLNRYSYVINDPINLADPTGLGPCNRTQRANGDCDHHAPNDAVASWMYCDPLGEDCGGTCYVNGFASSCGWTENLLDSGLAEQCPNNFCSGFVNGSWEQFRCGGTACGYQTMAQMLTQNYECGASFCSAAGYLQWAIQQNPAATASQKSALIAALAKERGISLEAAAALISTDPAFLQGGNLNYTTDQATFDAYVAACGASPGASNFRCGGGLEDSLHFREIDGAYYVHLDTANPFASFFGFFVHTGIDVLGGKHLVSHYSAELIYPRHNLKRVEQLTAARSGVAISDRPDLR